jgi:hypothetical protein
LSHHRPLRQRFVTASCVRLVAGVATRLGLAVIRLRIAARLAYDSALDRRLGLFTIRLLVATRLAYIPKLASRVGLAEIVGLLRESVADPEVAGAANCVHWDVLCRDWTMRLISG